MSYTGNEISNYSHAIVTAIGVSALGGCECFRQTDEADGFVFVTPDGEGTIRRTITTPDPSWTVRLPDGRTATHIDPVIAINNAVDATMVGTFIVEIEPGSDAMQSRADVGAVLRELGEKIDGDGWTGEGTIQDGNGNSVGRWTFHDFN